MKFFMFLLSFTLLVPVFAQTEKTDQSEPPKSKPTVNPPEIQEQQANSAKKPTNPFQLGPYKDGAYQFWGDEELKERDEREEENQ